MNLSCISSTSNGLILVCRIKIKYLIQNPTWTIGNVRLLLLCYSFNEIQTSFQVKNLFVSNSLEMGPDFQSPPV